MDKTNSDNLFIYRQYNCIVEHVCKLQVYVFMPGGAGCGLRFGALDTSSHKALPVRADWSIAP